MSAACWADPLSRKERRVVAELLGRACRKAWAARRAAPVGPAGDAQHRACTAICAEMSDLHLDVTERAEVPAS